MRASIAGGGCSLANHPDAIAIVYYNHAAVALGTPNTTAWPAFTASVTGQCANVSSSHLIPPFNLIDGFAGPAHRNRTLLPHHPRSSSTHNPGHRYRIWPERVRKLALDNEQELFPSKLQPAHPPPF